jgi:hypothetical protein
VRLTHRTLRTLIVNQDATSIRRRVLICVPLRPVSRRSPDTDPSRPLRPDCVWCTTPASGLRLVHSPYVFTTSNFLPFISGRRLIPPRLICSDLTQASSVLTLDPRPRRPGCLRPDASRPVDTPSAVYALTLSLSSLFRPKFPPYTWCVLIVS